MEFQNLTIIQKPSFISEIDWSRWNCEIPDNPDLLKEYVEIEKKHKSDGTWLKTSRDYHIFSDVDEIQLNNLNKKLQNNDIGSYDVSFVKRLKNNLEIAKKNSTIYQGTPEQFVQELSENFKNVFPSFGITYRGSIGNRSMRGNLAESTNQNIGSISTADKKIAIAYSENRIIKGKTDTAPGILELVYKVSDNSLSVDAKKNSWKNIPRDNLPELHNKLKPLNVLLNNTSESISTDDIAHYIQEHHIDYCIIKNVRDGPSYHENLLARKEIIFNHRLGNYLKSRWYNNGMFDMQDANIYR